MQDAASAPPLSECTTLFTGGRVIDPETGLDGILNVGVTDGVVSYVGSDRPRAKAVIDVSGCVLSPGFIDIHSHAQSPLGLRLQAMDGVTTALDLEAGALPIGLVYDRAECEGRPINFGFSSSWALARLAVVEGVRLSDPGDPDPLPNPVGTIVDHQTAERWNEAAGTDEVDRILALVEQGVHEGGIGIGVLLGLSPRSGRDEYFRIAALASRLGVPVFTHSRQVSNVEPGSSLDGVLEILGAGAGSGAAMHICHLNSTSLQRIDEIAAAVERAQAIGNRITTEAYPYGRSSTGIGAPFFAPDQLHRLGITPRAMQFLPTGERVNTIERLDELRRSDPGGICIIDYLDEDDPEQLRMLLRSLTVPNAAIASDAMPMLVAGSMIRDAWPVPDDAAVHPRSAGCFARTFAWLVRDLGVFSLAEAVRRCTFVPATILQDAVPAMRRKGRVQVGADADLTIFDPHTIADLATFDRVRPSTGFRFVMVNGEFVVREGEPVLGATPGRAIRSSVTGSPAPAR